MRLSPYCEERSLGEVFAAPTDVILTARDVFVPDLLVVGDATQVTDRGIESAPALVVEVLSPSTQGRDRGIKAQRYAELGVEHYWLVDPQAQHFECHRLVDGSFRLIVEAKGEERLRHPDWPGLEIDLAALFRDAP